MFSRVKNVDRPRSWLVESHNETFILQNAKTQPGFYFEKPSRFVTFILESIHTMAFPPHVLVNSSVTIL